MNRAAYELLLVFALLGDTVVHAVCCHAKPALLPSIMKRFRWSLAERISRQLVCSGLRTVSSVAARMLSWGHAEQLSACLCAALAHLQ